MKNEGEKETAVTKLRELGDGKLGNGIRVRTKPHTLQSSQENVNHGMCLISKVFRH